MPTAYAHRALPATILALAVLALLVPMRWQRWAGAVGDQIRFVTGPISGPISQVAGWLHGTRRAGDDDQVQKLNEHLEQATQQLLQSRLEIRRLEQIIQDLQGGRSLNPDLRVRLLAVSTIGSGSDPAGGIMIFRAGARQHVTTNSVAVAPGWQLLGRVVDVGERTCEVQPITAKNTPPFAARVIFSRETLAGLQCTLAPRTDGSLSGPIEDRRDPATGAPVEPSIGQEVRLDDPAWPNATRMMLVGRIERIDPAPQQPLRKIITVRPTVDHLHRISEAFLCIPDGGSEDAP